MEQRRFRDRADQPHCRAPGQNRPGGEPEQAFWLFLLAVGNDARGGQSGKAGERDRDRSSERGAVEQVQEIEAALALADVAEVKPETADAGG